MEQTLRSILACVHELINCRKSDSITKLNELKPDAPHPSSPPSKKARSPRNAIPAIIKGDDLEKPPLFTLPPLLSPAHLSIEKPPVFSLPPLLSPTLPTTIEAQLKKIREEKNAIDHQPSLSEVRKQLAKTNSPEPSIQKGSLGATKPSGKDLSIPSKISDKDNLRPLSKGQKNATTNGVAASKSLPNGATHHAKTEDPTRLMTTPPVSKPERKRFLVKLKIPKAVRKRCAQLLKLQPLSQKQADQRTPKPTSTEGPNGERITVAKANGASKTEPGKDSSSPLPDSKSKYVDDKLSASRSAEKRRRREEDGDVLEPASKRRKQPESLEFSSKPHTPLRPPLVSPVLSQHGSASKTHLSTPMRDLKSTAMRRIGSSEGDVKTPVGAVRGSTPVATSVLDRSSREGRSTSSAPSGNLDVGGSERLTVLKAEQGRFSGLGRTLKHTVQKMLPAENDFKTDAPVTRQGAAIAFEALLAFLLSFVILDEMNKLYGKSPEVTAWRSLLGFFKYVKEVTQLYRPVRGLVHQLEGVCRDTIALYDAQRLERDSFLNSLLDDNRPSTANSNPALSPSVMEKSKAKTDFAKFRSEHVDNLRTAQVTWQAGFSKLPTRELQRQFPASWAKSADIPCLGKGKEEIIVGKYIEGSYYLPLGPASTGLEAVRAGWRMLDEWCSREGVKWEGKMGL